ncbi:6041_t:CDS:2, partial [Paraglomus occultum]
MQTNDKREIDKKSAKANENSSEKVTAGKTGGQPRIEFEEKSSVKSQSQKRKKKLVIIRIVKEQPEVHISVESNKAIKMTSQHHQRRGPGSYFNDQLTDPKMEMDCSVYHASLGAINFKVAKWIMGEGKTI